MAISTMNRSALLRRGRFLMCAASLALLAGCGGGGGGSKTPSGQVVANVNGDEITRTALTAEMVALGIPPDQRAGVQDRVLQQMVDRKLMAQAARTQKLDQSPGFVVLRARTEEGLLAQSYIDRLVGENRAQPSQAEIAAYLAERPWVGRDRAILTVDQIRFQSNGDANAQALVKRAPTMDGLVRELTAAKIKINRGQTRIDTGIVPDEIMSKIATLGPAEPLIVFNNGEANAISVASREAQPSTEAVARDLARNRIIATRSAKMMEDRRASLRAAAKIELAEDAPAAPAATKAGQAQPARPDSEGRAKF